jgi:hypothetical protein
LLLLEKFKPLGLLSTMRSKIQSNGLDATPSPSKTLVATTTPSVSTSFLPGPSTTYMARVTRQVLDRRVEPA